MSFIGSIVTFAFCCLLVFIFGTVYQDENYKKNKDYLKKVANEVADKLVADYQQATDEELRSLFNQYGKIYINIVNYDVTEYEDPEWDKRINMSIAKILEGGYSVYSKRFIFRGRYSYVEVINKYRGYYVLTTVGIILFFIISFLLFLYLFISSMSREINYILEIQQGVQEIEEGNFAYKCPIKGQTEIAQLARSINDMSDALHQKIENERHLEESKQQLITNVSHDLRTPLTSIIGYLGLIDKTQDVEKQKKYIKICSEKASKLKGLIDDLFQYNKLANNQIRFNIINVPISYYVDQIISEYVPLLEETGFQFTYTSNLKGEEVCIDPEQTIRVFDNLFGNIMKYARKNTLVTLSAIGGEEFVDITLSNIPKDGMEINVVQIFEKTVTSDDSRTGSGSGLGLAIAKEIITHQEGEIHADMFNGRLLFNIRLRRR